MTVQSLVSPDWRKASQTEKIEIIRRFSLEGYSATQIACEFVNCPGRNAIIGYWNRHPESKGVPHVRTARSYRWDAPSETVKPVVCRRKSALAPTVFAGALVPPDPGVVADLPPEPVPAEPAAPCEPVAFIDRSLFQCAWVLPDRGSDGLALCCGQPVHRAGSSWCNSHAARIYARAA